MKKILSIMLCAALAVPMFAEKQTPEEVAKADYTSWLPATGDFYLGFSLDPFANFVGKMFSTSGGEGTYKGRIGGQMLLDNAFTSPVVSIMGGYMLSDQLAVKANIGFIVDYQRNLYNVNDDAALFANPFSQAQVQDMAKKGQYGGSFSAGVEYRIGKGRVQGVFGGGLVYAFQTNSNVYSYGNAITSMNQTPTISDKMPKYLGADNPVPGVFADMRVLNDAVSGDRGQDAFFHRFGLYTSAGVECFVAPKVAIGFNVNLDLLYKWGQDVAVQYEGFNLLTNQVEKFTDTKNTMSYSGVTFGTENIGANLYMHFYLNGNKE